jgi:hypothetical protein
MQIKFSPATQLQPRAWYIVRAKDGARVKGRIQGLRQWPTANCRRGIQRSYISHPSILLTGLSRRSRAVVGVASCVSTFAYSVLSSSSSHNSSSSSASSAGLSKPPTFDNRSRSAALASRSICSFSSANNSALSPANSFNWIRKSRRLSLNRS